MPAATGHCPACGRPVGRKDRLCTGCGRDLRTGESASTTLGEVRAGPGVLAWIWENLLGMLGCTALTVALAVVCFLIARGDPGLTQLYRLAVVVAIGITLLLLAVAIVREDGVVGLLMANNYWFWYSDSTDGRLKGVLAGLIVAAGLMLPLNAALPAPEGGGAGSAAGQTP